MRRSLAPALLVLALAALVAGSDALRTRAHGAYAQGQSYEAVYYLPPPEWLRVFSLGWDEALADLIWMRALVYFGEEFQHGGNVSHVFSYGEAMLTLDPDFRAVYRWVGVAGMYRPQAVTERDIERSIEFLQRGAARFPDDGELAWDVGASLVFELGPLIQDEERKREIRARGMPYLMQAARLGAAPDWAVLSNASLLERIGRNEQAARHLEEMYVAVDDPDLRERIGNRIRQLRERAEAEAFVAAMEELERGRRRDFPYLPLGLYLLVGPRPVVDLSEPIREGLPAALTADPHRSGAR